jgi:hypothetical protein
MNKNQTERVFQFPCSRKYPVDQMCERIVRALQARNFAVPGLKIAIKRPSWSNEEFVTNIQGPNFEIDFDNRDSIAAVEATRIHIPGKQLRLHSNLRHIVLQLGSSDPKVASGRENQPRERVYVYWGSQSESRVFPALETLPIYLFATEDTRWLERGMPSHFLTRDVFTRFNQWLRENVIAQLESGGNFESVPMPQNSVASPETDELRRRLETTEFCS